MLRIECPNCGPRDETELVWGGEAAVVRPAEVTAVQDKEWTAYLYHRNNLRGPSEEWWYCRLGCRTWFQVRRDTTTDAVQPAARTDAGIGSGGR